MKKSGGNKKREKPTDDPDIVEAFQLFALDDELDPGQVKLALLALGIEKAEDEVLALVKKRGMNLAEFAKLATSLGKTRNDAEEAWEVLDEDGKGFLVF
jgi:Ca2+-binding EF-hand superfamily protein